MSLTFTDIFCGAGGSSIGLTAAGLQLRLAANHWQRAIETHSANFRDAEHLCADVNNYDMRRLPSTDVLWASPICTEASPAGGRPSRTCTVPGQGDLLEAFGPISRKGFERTRATFWDVIRATEVHRYRVVLVENVPDVARWELFDHWVAGMLLLGYRVQYVSVSSAHIGDQRNLHAPQWRDRLYLVFTRTGIELPDVDPHPVAWCQTCSVDVHAVQAWKKPDRRRIGKYRQQYVYVCPNAVCRNSVVEPYVLPAAAAIDWSDLGRRIGDRAEPLADNTMTRIRAGLSMFADRHVLLTVNHAGHDGRAHPADAAPLPAQTKRIGNGIISPPMLVPAGGTWNNTASAVTAPMRTRTAREAEALLTPEPFIAVLRKHGTAHSIDQPLRTIAAGGHHHALVVPYRRGNKPTTTGDPLRTMSTRDSGALVQPAVAVEDCRFRMLKPREQLRAQRFPDTYQVLGNVGEQTMQAGNAVSANVAQWLGQQVTTALDQ
ncbi:DNA cytosine methyltransferase [Allorhizocola rhizosphaerae]|uniref:DNA cytosine methyltransferase n=1 Tax=Allorhizocola rhizosphaerae TaxID=1872709 RepID=UPI000E3C4C14|nr:DNA cytosine methyltransferase [Allorhizocola rhizosphaerae]